MAVWALWVFLQSAGDSDLNVDPVEKLPFGLCEGLQSVILLRSLSWI